MKAVAFAPGHISGFFEPVFHLEDISRTGSKGAGINIMIGATSEVAVGNSSKQAFNIYINGKKTNAPVTNLALKLLLGRNPIHVVVKTKLDLPIGQGFGMSAAGALSATYALSKIIGFSNFYEAIKASHYAEVQMKAGLGDVMASSFGGIEIRKSPGLPPWGIIEHIPGKPEIVLCIIGKKVDTKKVLSDPRLNKKIVEYGKFCTKKILENPSLENLLYLSQVFTNKTGLASKRVKEAIFAANRFGTASMCMLGNSVFAIGKTNDLCKVLSSYGKVFVCRVDEYGARAIDFKK
jgi:pantoate kinase